MLQELLPSKIYGIVTQKLPINNITELRLRLGKLICVKDIKTRYTLNYVTNNEDLQHVIKVATHSSLYAYADEIKAGFLPYNGLRIGLCGRAVADNNQLLTIKDITSLTIRIPHEIVGVANKFSDIISNFKSLLVISPPYGGKTTLIRDFTRILSHNYDLIIIDERNEIYSSQYTFGNNLDVISGTRKELIYEGIIRAMSPEIVVLDEILPSKDINVLQELKRAGIKLIASLHGNDYHEISKAYPFVTELFDYFIVLSNKPSVGSIKSFIGNK